VQVAAERSDGGNGQDHCSGRSGEPAAEVDQGRLVVGCPAGERADERQLDEEIEKRGQADGEENRARQVLARLLGLAGGDDNVFEADECVEHQQHAGLQLVKRRHWAGSRPGESEGERRQGGSQ
jgi:hypothetical protein